MTPGTVKVYKLTQAGYNPKCLLSYEYSNIITIWRKESSEDPVTGNLSQDG